MKLDNKESMSGLVILCFAIIYIVWGTTYLFASFALEQIPAFRLCGFRYVLASFVTFLITFLFFKPERITSNQFKNACIAGVVFMGLGTGGAIWSLNYLDTGLTALIIAGEPLIIVLMLWAKNRKAPAFASFQGIFLGILGMYLLVSQDVLVETKEQWIGVLIIFLSMLAWGSGSIFVSKADLPESDWLNSSIQMMAGGLSTMIISLIMGEEGAAIIDFTMLTYLSLAFLIVFGSVIAFTAFNYLLRNVSTEKVVTNTYVNPIVAMILGYIFKDEPITSRSIIAALLMLSGVFIINRSKGTKQSPS